MATLQNIRNRGVLIAIVVGVAMLAFVIGDFLNSGSSIFQERKQIVGEIAGEKIKYQEFQAAIDQLVDVYKIELGRSNFNEDEMGQIRNQVWETMVNNKLLELEAQKMGLKVSLEELKDQLIGNNIHPLITQRRAFADPNTGQFSKEALLQFYSTVFDGSLDLQSAEQMREYKTYWLYWENLVKNDILQNKYFSLITNSVGANKLEAKYNFDARNQGGDVDFVYQAYSLVSDSLVSVSDAEIKSYYDKNKSLYKQNPNRTLKYVSFEVAPMEEDYKLAEEWMERISKEFVESDDVVGIVNTESDIAYNDVAVSRDQVPTKLRDFAFSSAKGAIYGPVFENDTYTMAKLMETGIMESDSVKLRMIVMPSDDKVKVDSVKNAIRSGADFAKLVAKYSDPSMADNGGEIGWITRTMVGKEISEPAFSKSNKEVFDVDAGEMVQIFQIIEKTAPKSKVKLAILEHMITPSNTSYSVFYNEAKQLAASASNSVEKFVSVAEEKGYIVREAENVQKTNENIHMIPQSRQIVRWAFENKKGTVSDVFDCDRNIYVVSVLTEVNEKEYVDMDVVSSSIKSQLINDKKAEVLIDKINDLNKSNSLEELALALETEVATAFGVNFASYQFGDRGNEPFVIGKASSMGANQISKPLKGKSGVYVIKTLDKTADETPFVEEIEMMQLNSRLFQSLPQTIIQKLRDKYNVIDNRVNFY